MSPPLSHSGPVEHAVARFLRQRDRPGERWLAAVSGGADSVALLTALRAQLPPGKLVAAHLNHQLRGGDSDADAAWVAQLCATWSLPLVAESRPVASLSADWGVGCEEGARRARYEFLEEAARQSACDVIALAHTASDQAETILHHLLRGTGLAGLRGIPEQRPLGTATLVRPLLEVTRDEIAAYLAARGQDHRTDHTNEERTATRNRLRLDLLPQLRAEYNPQIDRALTRLARQVADVQTAVVQVAEQLWTTAREPTGLGVCVLAWQKLANSPQHVLREMFVLIWQHHGWPRQAMGFDHWNRLADLVHRGGRLDLPGGVVARREGRTLTVERREAGPPCGNPGQPPSDGGGIMPTPSGDRRLSEGG
jgi:tRNA(Ile)-lysidine synthase